MVQDQTPIAYILFCNGGALWRVCFPSPPLDVATCRPAAAAAPPIQMAENTETCLLPEWVGRCNIEHAGR